jgi:hypothetical protein
MRRMGSTVRVTGWTVALCILAAACSRGASASGDAALRAAERAEIMRIGIPAGAVGGWQGTWPLDDKPADGFAGQAQFALNETDQAAAAAFSNQLKHAGYSLPDPNGLWVGNGWRLGLNCDAKPFEEGVGPTKWPFPGGPTGEPGTSYCSMDIAR